VKQTKKKKPSPTAGIEAKYPRVCLTPRQFELQVKEWIDAVGMQLSDYKSVHREKIAAPDGEYEIDITARFTALGGANFLTLIECKQYEHRVKRDLVQALWSKVQALGAHKGIMFATCGYQSGGSSMQRPMGSE
jgi:restriction system protein